MTISAGTLTDVKDDGPMWGTWEELLLAFAVNRHGTGAWDSIAAELQKRSSDPALPLTANNCKLKYMDLKRRFMLKNGDLSDDVPDEKSKEDESVTLLEELRRLRVAELRREVERNDLNIESLELKMKKMEEDREKKEPDLEKGNRTTESETNPVIEQVAEEDSEKDQLSVNESNSTDLRAEKIRIVENEDDPVQTGRVIEEPVEEKTEPDTKSESCNGSSNSIEKKPDREKKAVSADLVESSETKETSDVQSSASRSRVEKEGSQNKVRKVKLSEKVRKHEEQSKDVKQLSGEMQRLFDFIQIIRSHKFGSVFERRLKSQESSKYQKLILQHVDLETVETRLKEGRYSKNKSKFFRDLLLIVNNALVFFNKNSSEAKAAIEVRNLISKEISQKSTKSESSSGKQISPQSHSMSKKESPAQSLLLKPSISESIKVCRSKRSSIAAKASTSDKKKEPGPLLDEKRDTKEHSQPSSKLEESKITKKRSRDSFSPVSTSSKKPNKIPTKDSSISKKPPMEKEKEKAKMGPSSTQSTESKKKNESTTDAKKRGAANFLSRMKQGSSSSTKGSTLLDALKNTPLTSESGKRSSESKKNDNVKHSEKKEHVSKKIVDTRHVKEKESPDKKNIGRPPKRGGPPPTPPSPAVGKRVRGGEGESSGSKQPKKRKR